MATSIGQLSGPKLTQASVPEVLTGHGCFGGYLCRIAGREPDARCHHCDDCLDETAQHTLEVCLAWASQRRALRDVIGDDLSLPAVVKAMAGRETS